MSKKKKIAVFLCVIIAILSNVFVLKKVQPKIEVEPCEFVIEFSADKNLIMQCFYAENKEFSEENSYSVDYNLVSDKMEMRMPINTNVNYIRVDFGNIRNNTKIYAMDIKYKGLDIPIDIEKYCDLLEFNCVEKIQYEQQYLNINAMDEDPYIVIPLDNDLIEKTASEYWKQRYLVYDIGLCIIIDLLCVLCAIKAEKIAKVPLELYRNRALLWDLSKNDFQSRFAGSYLGIFWAFAQPVVTMLLYWFVFQVGLRAGSVSDYPFILYLMAGMIPWFYFSEALNGATNCLMEYSYLVKKVVFEINILPIIKIISSIFVHLFFVAFIIVMCMLYGFNIDFYTVQIIYYIFCTCFFVAGLSYITSACTVFFRDMSQIINIILTMGVWITPIMWNPSETLPDVLHTLFKANPVYYIVDGFRDALLAKEWFWDKPIWTVYFWIVSFLVYYVGISLYTRLKPHFSDVL